MQILHKNQRGRPLALYDLEVIISVGYRVKSPMGTQFRRWATKILRDYAVRGIAINRQHDALAAEMDRRFANHGQRIYDRFIICDDTVWLCGASVKDAGRRLFALVKMTTKPDFILNQLPR